ncbi:MAG: argininosuccinate lyase [Acidobacteriota bacterium]
MGRRLAKLAILCAVFLLPSTAMAGTQDFTLVNQTGIDIYQVFISETSNDDWEEDVMGRDILPDGGRVDISFSNRSACLWDMMVTDEEGGSVTWSAINLCESYVVVLRCNDDECWAEYE